MKTFIITAASLGLCSLAAGCLYEIRDEIVDCEIGCRNKHRANVAWDACAEVYEDMEYRSDFKDGFMEGYTSVANGGNGCPPAIPPTKYWKAKFQSEEGKCRTNAWFDGFTHGAVAAEGDGAADINRIVSRGGRRCPEIVLPTKGEGAPVELTPMEDREGYLAPPPSPSADVESETRLDGVFNFDDEASEVQ